MLIRRWLGAAAWIAGSSQAMTVEKANASPPLLFAGRGFARITFLHSQNGMERRGGASGACATRTLWHPLRSGCRASCEDARPRLGGGCASPALHRACRGREPLAGARRPAARCLMSAPRRQAALRKDIAHHRNKIKTRTKQNSAARDCAVPARPDC